MKHKLTNMMGLHGRHDVTHPVSGRSILFVNPLHTHGFQGIYSSWSEMRRTLTHDNAAAPYGLK